MKYLMRWKINKRIDNMSHRENRHKRQETRHLIDVKNRQRIAAAKEKVAVKIGTHT